MRVHDAPTVGCAAYYVEVAGAGEQCARAEFLESVIDEGEFELQVLVGGLRNLDFDDDFVALQIGCPQLFMFFVVGGGEGTVHFRVVGGVEEEFSAARHEVFGEAEVNRFRAGGFNFESPHGVIFVGKFP